MTSLNHIMEESDKRDTAAPHIYLLTKSITYSDWSPVPDNTVLDWYVIKNDDSSSKTGVLSPHLSPLPHDCNLSTHVVIGSTIYIVGGYICDVTGQYNKTRAVYYMDIRHPENGWKEAAPMNNERICPSAFGVDRKLYVFGGCNYNRHSYVEVNDPICNTWENFPRLKDGRDLPRCVSVQMVIGGENDYNEKKVLLREIESSRLYLYDIVSGSCEAINENLYMIGKSSALLDGVLYCVGPWKEDEINAYDLEHLDSTPKSVINMWDYTGFDDDYEERKRGCRNSRILVSKGNGMLAVLCPVYDDCKDNGAHKIGCFNFQMVKGRRSNGELYVKANLLSSSSHFVNGNFYECLTVFADPLPLADQRERYMLVNGGLKRASTTCSPAATESAVSIYQLQELLSKSMDENEKKTKQRILQRVKSRLESMESRIISRVQGAPSPRNAEISRSVKGQSNTHQPTQQRSLFMDSGITDNNISDSNARHSRRELQKDTKMTSFNHETKFIDEKYSNTPDIYVCLDGGLPHWYIIKNDDGTSQCLTPYPQLSQPPHDFTDSAHAVIGSTIYMAGGSYGLSNLDEYISGPRVLKTRDVYYMDTSSPQPEWKEASPMKYEKDDPYAFVVDGKIYVAGGTICEVYDSICDKWENVPPMQYGHKLPDEIRGHMVISGDGDKEKKVLLVGHPSYSHNSNIYLYDIDSGSCQVIKLINDGYRWVASVVADGILYCLEERSQKKDLFAYDLDNLERALFAYDLDNLERAPKLVTGLEKYLPSDNYHRPIHMVSLGNGKLAAVCTIESRTSRHKVLLSCSKFQITKGINANGELAFESHLLSCSTDPIQGYYLIKCLTVKTPSIVNLDDKIGEKAESTSNNTNLLVNEIEGLMSDQNRDTEKLLLISIAGCYPDRKTAALLSIEQIQRSFASTR